MVNPGHRDTTLAPSPHPNPNHPQPTNCHTNPLGGCTIEAPTVYGAMHGMETMVQLVSRQSGPATCRVPAVTIQDRPRFPFRATMIDTYKEFDIIWDRLSRVPERCTTPVLAG